MGPMLTGITFDFWDTLVADDSDEPERAARGLPPKPEARAAAFSRAARAAHPGLTEARARAAFDEANRWFTRRWKDEHRTPTVADRLDVALADLGVDRFAGFDALVAELEDMEVEIPPALAPGAAEMLARLSERYALGIISDTIVTPGRGLRRILEDYGLLRFFTPAALTFSDEVGAAKPDGLVFRRAAAAFGAAPGALLHVGDREANDVDGPLAAGWRCALYTGVIDRRAGPSRATFVCSDHRALPGLLAGLES
jgi:FMN phosphatase YigB (HAD superfamily)